MHVLACGRTAVPDLGTAAFCISRTQKSGDFFFSCLGHIVSNRTWIPLSVSVVDEVHGPSALPWLLGTSTAGNATQAFGKPNTRGYKYAPRK